MIRQVRIETVDPKRMRYKTVGDWFFENDSTLVIQVADTGKWIFNMLVAIHELIEAVLCHAAGISQYDVDNYDLAHQDDDDPGMNSKAPYHVQHMIAYSVEMILASKSGVDWNSYEDRLEKIVEGVLVAR